MTTDKAPVTVEQGDRLAAAKLIGKIGLSWSGDMIRAGKSDDHDYVKAFASHRLQSTAALEEEIAKYRTLLARWVEWSCGQQGPSPFHDTRTALEGGGS